MYPATLMKELGEVSDWKTGCSLFLRKIIVAET
jgi:hypothetical protein